MSRRSCRLAIGVVMAVGSAVEASLTFSAAGGYAAQTVWTGGNVAHFAVDAGDFYLYGAEPLESGGFENVVRYYDGANTMEIARSPSYAANAYFPDAITAVGGAVYWAHAQSFTAGGATRLFKTRFDGANWTTTTVFDESAGINVTSLATDGSRVFGAGLGAGGDNVAFFLDDADAYQVFADLPALGSGAVGFDPAGNFFAGAWGVDGDFAAHMYMYSPAQVAGRLAGTRPTPYAPADAHRDLLVPNNAPPVMESDGARLFGTDFKADFSGTDPFAFDLFNGSVTVLGTLGGAATAVTTDMYYRDGAVYFLGKNDWSTGSEAAVFRLAPEPASATVVAVGLMVILSRRRKR